MIHWPALIFVAALTFAVWLLALRIFNRGKFHPQYDDGGSTVTQQLTTDDGQLTRMRNRPIVTQAQLSIAPGQAVIVSGVRGEGDTFRAVAGRRPRMLDHGAWVIDLAIGEAACLTTVCLSRVTPATTAGEVITTDN